MPRTEAQVFLCPRYQEGLPENQVALVIHMTPEAVLRDNRYQQWMERYGSFCHSGSSMFLWCSFSQCTNCCCWQQALLAPGRFQVCVYTWL